MSEVLARVAAGFDRRMALRRRMLSHLDVDLAAEEAPVFYDELRQTLLGYGGCTCCAECDGWLTLERPGVPAFCLAREAFLTISEASTRRCSRREVA
ncbi:MAG: DUF6455 family protein [Paracoccaceae bacterium]|nr:DUF6455 family protein [Paracoccaceae bacterium]